MWPARSTAWPPRPLAVYREPAGPAHEHELAPLGSEAQTSVGGLGEGACAVPPASERGGLGFSGFCLPVSPAKPEMSDCPLVCAPQVVALQAALLQAGPPDHVRLAVLDFAGSLGTLLIPPALQVTLRILFSFLAQLCEGTGGFSGS